jgi:FMN phosphatase YigB (HAD superfamily)
MDDIVFLFDVDNTLLDNDSVQDDLRAHLAASYGAAAWDRYWAIFKNCRANSATRTIWARWKGIASKTSTIRESSKCRAGLSITHSRIGSILAR